MLLHGSISVDPHVRSRPKRADAWASTTRQCTARSSAQPANELAWLPAAFDRSCACAAQCSLLSRPTDRRSCFNLRHLANTPCLQLLRVFIHWAVPCSICQSAAATNKRRQLKHIGTGDGDHKTAQNTTKRSGDQNRRQPSAANNTMHFTNYAKKTDI